MELFRDEISAIRAFFSEKRAKGAAREFIHRLSCGWPVDTKKNIVLAADTAVELGHPADGSVSFLLCTDDAGAVVNNRITLLGPDIPELVGCHVPFVRIVICAAKGFNAENIFERYRQMDLLRYDIRLAGYMMRGVSQYMREWSRVSHDAVRSGFNFKILGSALVDAYSALDFIKGVEVMFATSAGCDMPFFEKIGRQAADKVFAMNKMAEELSFDCESCEYNPVCRGVEELRVMRKALLKRKMENGA